MLTSRLVRHSYLNGEAPRKFLRVLQGGRPNSSMESAFIECFRSTLRIVLATLTLDADILSKKPDKYLLIDALCPCCGIRYPTNSIEEP